MHVWWNQQRRRPNKKFRWARVDLNRRTCNKFVEEKLGKIIAIIYFQLAPIIYAIHGSRSRRGYCSAHFCSASCLALYCKDHESSSQTSKRRKTVHVSTKKPAGWVSACKAAQDLETVPAFQYLPCADHILKVPPTHRPPSGRSVGGWVRPVGHVLIYRLNTVLVDFTVRNRFQNMTEKTVFDLQWAAVDITWIERTQSVQLRQFVCWWKEQAVSSAQQWHDFWPKSGCQRREQQIDDFIMQRHSQS